MRTHSLSICFALALVVSTILSFHVISGPVIPIADGEGYALRAFALYGYLHTGQWGNFANLLASPSQSILPLHYVPFFLLPQTLAGIASYIILQNFVTYCLLAYAIFVIASELKHHEWAPCVFLFCSVNNIIWIDFYSFFLDPQFLALGLLAIAWQLKAWNENRWRTSILSGIVLGLLFWLKPANAVIFLATYIFSEIFYWGYAFRLNLAKGQIKKCGLNLLINTGAKMAGFIPTLSAALICGALQSILQLIDQNEVHELVRPVAAGGLLRWFYFPFCLAAFYHVVLLGTLLIIAFVLNKWILTRGKKDDFASVPLQLVIPILISYLIFGEFFSFWMTVKPMRALLLILPLFWFGVCWLWGRQRLSYEVLLFVASIYAISMLAQKTFNVFGTKDQLVEDNYQLTTTSWTEMPSPWHRGSSLNRIICDKIIHDLPPSGVICVNSIELRNTLAWKLGNKSFLRGNFPSNEVRNIFNYKGAYYDQALVGANIVALITLFQVQPSRSVWLNSMGILDYGNEAWCGPHASAQLQPLPSIRGEPVGYEFRFQNGLTQSEVDQANASAPFAGLTKAGNQVADSVYGRHYSKAEAWQLLETWFDKRFK